MAGGVPAELREALLEHGPDMLSLVLAMTPLRFAWVPGYADYYPEAPGGLAAGRSIEPVPLDGRVLGTELAHLGRPYLPSPARPPFYAVKIVPGDLGTKGGLRIDERARVLRADGTQVEGLYAGGNASASVMGHSYAGAGATIGPAMTFGYIAARTMAAGQ